MKRSSAQQLELDYSASEFSDSTAGGATAGSNPDVSASDQYEWASSPFRVPSPNVSRELYAIGSRQAGRLNAAIVSDEEINRLLRERKYLLDKRFAGTMTKKEENKLTYIRWSLDRIEDARHGQALDALESLISRYEQFQADLRWFEQELSRQKTGHRY